MSINKPFFRIYRPGAGTDYISDLRYCNEVNNLHRSFKLIEYDLKQVFQFVEPHEDNLSIYSNRLYELLLRACTEFEASAKSILEANGYSRNEYLRLSDYRKLNVATRLSEYEVILDVWNPGPKSLFPFSNWKHSHSLDWYNDYNEVKHNRFLNFKNASLVNVINAVAGVYAILYAQIDYHTDTGLLKPGRSMMFTLNNDDTSDSSMTPMFVDSIFTIKRNSNWDKNSLYRFDWNTLKQEAEPFQKYTF